ncbi:MAG: metal ABC transporter ATP-binding protein [Ruminococcus flavefaciens]|nr:metal ABC transporter ATP-binding protein [Ruminococcus flavefaciens]MCM1229784.1 metal ABC transporter ATP-binding protein [Ruminococcus flavefaciens]
MSKQIICRNTALGYEDGIVTENLNFTVNSGDYLCILGENGSGKSTLIKALLGLKPQISGEIKWCDGFSARDIGYLPQQTPVQRDFPASVREIVLSGCLSKKGFHPFYNSAEKKLADDNMKQLGIESLAGRCYRELSGGQQQRVLLARALCATNKMLLLDEPVTGLDPLAQTELYELIAGLNRKGISIIMVSHDISSALKYATHILHISKKQLFFGTKSDYLNSEAGRAFIETEGF